MKPLALHVPLSYALRLLEARFRCAGITTTVEIPADLPLIWGSADQLELVFLNLLVNAWHAMPKGGSIMIQADVSDDQHVRLTFSDSGIGIPTETLERVFEPFFTTKENKGSGLGLSMCRQIMDSHRGSIILDSTPGKGTTVTIELLQANAVDKEDESQIPPHA